MRFVFLYSKVQIAFFGTQECDNVELKYITVGVIANTHGLRGDVKVLPRTDFPKKRFRKGSKLFIRKPMAEPEMELEILEAKPHQQFWLVRFVGFPSISDVEQLKGMELCVLQEQLADLPPGTYYVHQLIGLHVFDENGQELGVLKEVLSPGANDVYVVRKSGSKEEILLPAIPDCVLDVDIKAGTMRVHLLPGLLDHEDEPRT
jgi:16S rRNA processing protein RimM